jgi:carboxyl-terminal processing protease
VARGYIDGLRDSGCLYYTAEEYTQLQEIERGTRVGIGIEVIRDSQGFFIVKVYPSSPAAERGMVMGSYITQVDGVDMRSLTTVRALQARLYGDQGTTVEIVTRTSNEETTYSVQRVRYTAPTIEPLQMIDGFAYIRFNGFASTTASEFDYVVREAVDQGVLGFVFDVRGISGGSYDEAYKVIDLACGQGVIARAEYKNNTTKVLGTSNEDNKITQPMVVVVDGATSGPAELFAASVRELSGGQLVGLKTAGNGMLQSAPQRMSDGSAVVVTVAKMLTGKENIAWHGVGFTPDVEVTGSGDEVALYNVDPRTDPQVVRATALARSLARTGGTSGGTTATSTDSSDVSDVSPENGSGNESGTDTSNVGDEGTPGA